MPTYRIRLAEGDEFQCPSFEEFQLAILEGRIGDDAEVLNPRSGRWMAVRLHPHYSRARHAPRPVRRPARQSVTIRRPAQNPAPPEPAPVTPVPAVALAAPAVPPPVTPDAPPAQALEPSAVSPAPRGVSPSPRRKPPAVNYRWVLPLVGASAVIAWLLRAPEPRLFQGSEAARTSAAPFHHHRSPASARPSENVALQPVRPAESRALVLRYQDAYRAAEQDVASALGLVHFAGLFSPERLAPDQVRVTERALGEAGNVLREFRNRQIRIEQTYADTAAVLTREHGWPSGQEESWAGRGVLRESFDVGQQMDNLLASADSVLTLLEREPYAVQDGGIAFGDSATARRYTLARADLLRRLAAAGAGSAPFSLRVLAAGLGHPLPPEARP